MLLRLAASVLVFLFPSLSSSLPPRRLLPGMNWRRLLIELPSIWNWISLLAKNAFIVFTTKFGASKTSKTKLRTAKPTVGDIRFNKAGYTAQDAPILRSFHLRK